MSKPTKKNLAASVKQRLLNRANAEIRTLQELLQYYTMERFLYRLSVSDYSRLFILKGALTLQLWDVEPRRVTKDIDLLGEQISSEEDVRQMVEEVATLPVEDDGMQYFTGTLTVQPITKNTGYPGYRVKLKGGLGKPQITLQMDIGVGDAVSPEPDLSLYPVLLDFPAPQLLVYRRETAISEKFQAMVHRAEINSRMKDYYDLWLLRRQFEFVPAELAGALHATFERRQTELPTDAAAVFTTELIESLQPLWVQYHRTHELGEETQNFREVVQAIQELLQPALDWLAESGSRS